MLWSFRRLLYLIGTFCQFSYRIVSLHAHGVMSASFLGLLWTKTTRHRNYRPKTRSSQLNNVYVQLSRLPQKRRLAAYFHLKSPYQTSNTNTLLIIRYIRYENWQMKYYLLYNIWTLQASFEFHSISSFNLWTVAFQLFS